MAGAKSGTGARSRISKKAVLRDKKKDADAAGAADMAIPDDNDAITITMSIFGMSTEGYAIARQAAIGGATVFIIDESNLAAILLNAEIARTYPDISTLQEDEPILSFIALQEAVSKSSYLFFAPRIRTQPHNTRASMQSLFKDAVESVGTGSSVVFCVPAGVGDNSEYISVLQHCTGLEIGLEVSYYYYPLETDRRTPKIIGTSDGKPNPDLARMLSFSPESADAPAFDTLAVSEYAHALNVMSRFAQKSPAVEFGQFVPDEIKPNLAKDDRVGQLYMDGMIGGLLDMHLLELSVGGTKSMRRLAAMYAKVIDSYITRLVERTKQFIREAGMRTTKTKMIILWSFDPHLLRGDRNTMSSVLKERLHDWLADVDVFSVLPRTVFTSETPTAILPCTPDDFEAALQAKKERPDLLVIKATPLYEVFPPEDGLVS